MLGHNLGSVQVTALLLSHACVSFHFCILGWKVSVALILNSVTCLRTAVTKDCLRCADLVKHTHYTALPSPVAHALTNLPSKVIGTLVSAAGHNCLAGLEPSMLDGVSPRCRREVPALRCWVHTHRVSVIGTFPSCSLKNLGCNFAWMQGMYSIMSVCWGLSKLSWFLPWWKVC